MFDKWLGKHRNEIIDTYVELRKEQGDPRPKEALRQGAGFGIDVSIKSVLGEMNWEQATRMGAKKVLETGGSLDALSETAHSLFLAIRKILEKDRPDQAFEWLGIVGDYTLSGSETVAKVMEENLNEQKEALEKANVDLTSEIKEREEAQKQLQQFNETLEGRVRERTAEWETEKAFNETALSSLPGLFYVFDIEGKFARWNKQMEQIMGYSTEEMEEITALQLFKEAEQPKVAASIQEVFELGESAVDASMISKSGKRLPHLFTGKRQEIGGKMYCLGMGLDISNRIKAEQALKESEKKFKALADSTTANIGITQRDGEALNFVYANKALLDGMGITWEELSKIDPSNTLTQAGREAGRQASEEAVKQGLDKFSFEYENAPGVWIIVHVTIAMLDGKESTIWTSFDISEHKHAQLALIESEDKYRAIFETTGTGTIIFDDDSIIQLANDEWASLVACSREEMEGKKTWMEFISDESIAKMKDYHEKRGKNPTSVPRSYEADIEDCNGKIHSGIVTISVIPGTTQRVASFLDLTDLKKAQNQMYQADKMAALGQIIAGVAHEINNPNNFIYFNLPILKKYIDGIRPLLDAHLKDFPDTKILGMKYEVFLEDIYKLLENMEHGSSRITGIVADLKNYVRSDDTHEMKEEKLDKVITQVMTLLGKQVRKMVKHFDVDVAEGLPQVNMNAGKIEQVLINLLVNAGQAADKDDSFVKLKVHSATDGFIDIVIQDNGLGIPKASIDQIFEPFFTSKRREAGTGLGLSISHKIIEDHGGTIEVYSKEGEGTTFTVRLPVAQ